MPKPRVIIYELPYGIKVLHENHNRKYVMCRIEAHYLFPRNKIKNGAQHIYRSRLIMTASLGRVLGKGEHVHHKKKNEKHNDSIDNLELLSCDEHNKLHHIGLTHTEEAKQQIKESLKLAYETGKRISTIGSGVDNPFYGKKHSEKTKSEHGAHIRKLWEDPNNRVRFTAAQQDPEVNLRRRETLRKTLEAKKAIQC